MPKRKDENETAFDALQELLRKDAERDGIPQEPILKPKKVAYRVEAGRKGGMKGGKSKEVVGKQKKKITQKAAEARWRKSNKVDYR